MKGRQAEKLGAVKQIKHISAKVVFNEKLLGVTSGRYREENEEVKPLGNRSGTASVLFQRAKSPGAELGLQWETAERFVR